MPSSLESVGAGVGSSVKPALSLSPSKSALTGAPSPPPLLASVATKRSVASPSLLGDLPPLSSSPSPLGALPPLGSPAAATSSSGRRTLAPIKKATAENKSAGEKQVKEMCKKE